MAGYGSDAGFSDWLASNGYQLPAEAPEPAVLRQRGSVYIDGLYGSRFVGVAADGFQQERAWPRTGAEALGQTIPSTVTPVAIEHGSYAAAFHEAMNPGSLSAAASASRQVKRKKIDVIETEFFEGSGDAVADSTVRLAVVEGLLAPFLTAPQIAVFVV
ncbi:DnaT-like ssDNA-binding protein [Brevundimonas sp. GCM10030266]|uniref:DnaT-like ssDNA-binding protein n=1 Tax=Brevundimonas sp. GCM10030266 TaxID=3273386 RepID=UPI00361D7849